MPGAHRHREGPGGPLTPHVQRYGGLPWQELYREKVSWVNKTAFTLPCGIKGREGHMLHIFHLVRIFWFSLTS